MHNYPRFFVGMASELCFFRLKMVRLKEISVEKRAQIIILEKTAKNYREIAKILKISLCSVHTAVTRYRETGQNTNSKRSGRPLKTNQRIDNKIYKVRSKINETFIIKIFLVAPSVNLVVCWKVICLPDFQ